MVLKNRTKITLIYKLHNLACRLFTISVSSSRSASNSSSVVLFKSNLFGTDRLLGVFDTQNSRSYSVFNAANGICGCFSSYKQKSVLL